MKEMTQNRETKNPVWVKMSYGSREMFGQWFTIVFGSAMIFFYKQVLGLESLYVTIGFIIWSIWNAINDPLIGWLVEKVTFPWEKTKGFRRFPLVLIGAVPFMFANLMIYYASEFWLQWQIFLWMLLSLFLFDLFYSIFEVNATSLFPIKFPGLQERRSAQLYGTLLGIIGLTLGFVVIIPMMAPGGVESYRAAAWANVGGGILLIICMIPGIYEDKRLRQINKNRLIQMESQKNTTDSLKSESDSFFNTARMVFKNKRFLYKVIFFFGYQAAVALVNGSALYVVNFLIRDPDFMTLLMAMMLVGALITVPLWLYLANKFNDNKKTSILGSIIMIISFIPMMIVESKFGWMFAMFLFGVGLGGQWFMDPPTMGDILDDIVVKTGKRKDSIYYGYQSFIIRFGEAFKAIAITTTHLIFNLPAGIETYSELETAVPDVGLAVLGVRVHTALIPMILVIIATMLFWKYYDLTPAIVAENRKILAELNLVAIDSSDSKIA